MDFLFLMLFIAGLLGGFAAAFLYFRVSGKRIPLAEARLEQLLQHSQTGLVELDAQGHILHCNQAFSHYLDQPLSALIGASLSAYLHDPKMIEAFNQALAGETVSLEGQYFLGEEAVHVQVYRCRFVPIFSAEKPCLLEGILGFLEDIEWHREAEAHIRYLAHFDALTGLANRQLGHLQTAEAILSAKEALSELAVLYVDLDHFKEINESLGHPVGDRLLQKVAHRLRHLLNPEDTLARLGGDEFLIVISGEHLADSSADLAEKLIVALRQPFEVDHHILSTPASIGIALAPRDGDSAEVLIRNAASALSSVKANGRNHFQFYHPEMNASLKEDIELARELRTALEERQFELYYQPQINLGTGELIGLEALIRWRHPRLGFVSPARFIGLAEQRGLIVEIGAWALEEACRQNQGWHLKGLLEVPVAVNLSALQFQQRQLVKEVRRILEETGLPPAHLELEITESILLGDAPTIQAMLAELRAMGIRIAVDDFGTGYSSLSYLRDFPVDKLKIDQSFIRNLDERGNAAITEAIIHLGKTLGLSIIAEGVEEEGAMRFLRSLDCDVIQGYCISQPLSSRELEAFVKARHLPVSPPDPLE